MNSFGFPTRLRRHRRRNRTGRSDGATRAGFRAETLDSSARHWVSWSWGSDSMPSCKNSHLKKLAPLASSFDPTLHVVISPDSATPSQYNHGLGNPVLVSQGNQLKNYSTYFHQPFFFKNL